MAENPGAPSSSAAPAPPATKSSNRLLASVLRVAPLALFIWMVRTLLVPVVLGAIFALLLFPLEKRIAPKLGRAGRYAPALVAAGAVILVVIPLVLIGIKAVTSINEFIGNDWSSTVERAQDWFHAHTARYLERFHISPDNVRESVQTLARNGGRALAAWFGGLATTLPGYIVNVFLFTLALYFFLRDGRSLSIRLLKLSPFPRHDTEELFASIVGTVNGAILGVLVTALVQGALTMASLYIFKVPGAFLLGIAATVLAIIPMIGTTPVTVGATIYLFVIGRAGAGVGMLVMALFIGVSDNIVRPWVQSSSATMHPLLALLSIFGGLEVFGAAGIFIGPVLAAVAVWVFDTYTDLRLKQLARDRPDPGASSDTDAASPASGGMGG